MREGKKKGVKRKRQTWTNTDPNGALRLVVAMSLHALNRDSIMCQPGDSNEPPNLEIFFFFNIYKFFYKNYFDSPKINI